MEVAFTASCLVRYRLTDAIGRGTLCDDCLSKRFLSELANEPSLVLGEHGRKPYRSRMRYGHSSQVGDEGVAAIHHLVSRKMKWIFRSVTGPDVGIDAIVEQTGLGKATARWLSLQIKSGRSYFTETTDHGVVFRDSLEHLRYYRRHQLPVVVVLYDPLADEAIWQVVGEYAVETREGWKLIIPFGQRIDERTVAAWSRLLRSGGRPTSLKSEFRLVNGSLATIHDLLGAAKDELLVAAPYISVDFLALLDFLASRISVRVLTNEATIQGLLLQGRRTGCEFGMRTLPELHWRLLIVDHEALCTTSANFTQRGISAAREVLAIDTNAAVIRAAIDQFEDLWQKASAMPDSLRSSGEA